MSDTGILTKYSRKAYPLHIPTKPQSRQEIPAKRTASIYINNSSLPFKTDEA